MRPSQSTVLIKKPYSDILIDLHTITESGETITLDELRSMAVYYSKRFKISVNDILHHITKFAQEAGFGYNEDTKILTKINGCALKKDYKNVGLLSLFSMMTLFTMVSVFGLSRLWTFG